MIIHEHVHSPKIHKSQFAKLGVYIHVLVKVLTN